MTRKKVLIITYYWPPSGGSGVQRWVKFVKYLRDFGYEPVVYAPENPEYPARDTSLFEDLPGDLEVIKRPIWEPYSFYKKWVGMKKDSSLGAGLMKEEETASWKQKVSLWIRSNLFIPDARCFWIRPSIRFLTSYLKEHPVDAIISTGPPHSMHMIAKGLKKKTGLPWLADFRDPWTNIDFFEDLLLTPYSRNRHHKLEKRVLDTADKVVTVSPSHQKEYEELTDTEVLLITNGFDEADFPKAVYQKDEFFKLLHIGMMGPARNPQILWESIAELNREHEAFRRDFKLRLIGKVDVTVKSSIEEYELQDQVDLSPYIPHKEIVREQQQSDALLLIINEAPNANMIIPGKMFEYMAAQRPIVCLSPVEGDVQKMLHPLDHASYILNDQKALLKDELLRLHSKWKKGDTPDIDIQIQKYSRRSLTKAMAKELDALTEA